MPRRKLPAHLQEARLARAENRNQMQAMSEAIAKEQEAEEERLKKTPVGSMWDAKDPLHNPRMMLEDDTEEGRANRTIALPPNMTKKMTRELKPTLRESHAFNLSMAKQVCSQISQGMTLQQICGKNGLPSIMVINGWLQSNDRFLRMYNHARLLQADYLADEMLILATLVRRRPKMARAYKVAAEILKWQATVRNPSKYGERQIIDATIVHKTPLQIQQEIADLAREFNVPLANLPPPRAASNEEGDEDFYDVEILPPVKKS